MKVDTQYSDMDVTQLLNHCAAKYGALSDMERELATRLTVAMELIRLEQEFSRTH